MALRLDLDDLDAIASVHAPHLAPPETAMIPATGTLTPPNQPPVEQRPKLYGSGQEAFRAGMPTVTDQPGTPGFYRERIQQEEYKKQHPWGSPVSEHPGFLGKVAHGLAKAGNIAGDVFAPATMALIPGTDLNKRVQEASDVAGLEKAQQEERLGGEAKSKEELEAAQTEALKNPQPKPKEESWKVVPGMIGPKGQVLQEEQNSGQVRWAPGIEGIGGKEGSYNIAEELHKEHPDWPPEQIQDALAKSTNPIAGEVGNQQAFGVYDPRKGWVDPETKQPIKGFKPAPSKFPRVFPVNDAAGNITGYNVIIGDTTEFMPVGRFGGPGNVIPPKPTSTTLTMSQMAKTIEPQIDRYNKEIDAIADRMGPAVGRWNDFMTGKVGADDPKFAGFLSDTDALASAITRTHFGASGGQQYIDDMKKSFRASQSPEDLKARVANWNQWIAGYAAMTGGAPPEAKKETGGAAVHFTEGSDSWDIPADKIDAFQKKHPNAKRQ